jgi:16S rRNA (cytosine1402-N4)-methyltransferase
MLDEVLDGLMIKPQGHYLDATFGRGGHAAAILRQLDSRGTLVAMDRDPAAIATARQTLGADPRFTVEQGNFSEILACISRQGLAGQMDGVLLDLGVSSPQLDDAQRGFSFRSPGPLDMRMNPGHGMSAAEWLASASERDIARVLKEYGEERYARRIARTIVNTREQTPITTTTQLADLVKQASPGREQHKDPATRTFQALRIYINSELDELQQCLAQIKQVLALGGRLVVISFHSLEDRIVKRFIRSESQGKVYPPGLPVRETMTGGWLKPVGKAQKATAAEVQRNPRARSAVLRVAERIA